MKKKRSSFFRFMLPFICIFAIPILLWLFSNTYVVNKNDEKVLTVMMDTFERHVDIVDSDLNQIESFVYSLGMNSELGEFFNANETKTSYLGMKKIQQTMGTYDIGGMPILNVYLYNRSNNVLIDRNNPYRDSQDYFGTKALSLSEETDEIVNRLRKGEWENGFTTTKKYVYDGEEREILEYVRTVPFLKTNGKNANITVLVDNDKIVNTLTGFIDENECELYVFEKSGELILQKGAGSVAAEVDHGPQESSGWKEYSNSGKKYYRFICNSSENDWQYVVYIQEKYLFADAHKFGMTLNAITFLSFVLAIMLSAYFAFGRKKTYTNMKRMLGVSDVENKRFSTRMSEFSLLQPYIENVLVEKERAYDELSRIKQYDDERILYLLFSGFFNNEEKTQSIIADSSLNISGKHHIVMFVETDEDGISLNNSLEDNLKQYLEKEFCVFENDPGQMALLFSFDDDCVEFTEWLKDKLNSYHDEIFQYINACFGIGNVTDKFTSISKSFEEAKQVVVYNKVVGTEHMFFYDLPEKDTDYYYPVETENSMLNSILCSDYRTAKDTLQQIYRENFVLRELPLNKIEDLISEINLGLMRIQKETKNVKKYDFKKFTVSSFFTFAENFIEEACMETISNSEEKTQSLFDEITVYVKENYNNPDLSLVDVSSKFAISVTYVSRLFKRKMGINFYVFLESLRINKACEMLREGRVPIKEITTQVGYTNDATFRRAFKRKKGVSPSSYMKKKENI